MRCGAKVSVVAEVGAGLLFPRFFGKHFLSCGCQWDTALLRQFPSGLITGLAYGLVVDNSKSLAGSWLEFTSTTFP